MLSTHTGIFSRLLFFCMLGSLPYVSGHVIQWPRTAVDPILTLNSDVSNGSSLEFPHDASASLSQEEPPWELRVEYFWKQGARTFGRTQFFNTVLFSMATMALRPWNATVVAYKFPAPYDIAVGFVSDRSGPGLQVKHVLWTLEEVFDVIVEQNRFQPGNVVIQLVPITLGVANVVLTRADLVPSGPMDMLLAGLASNTTTGNPILISPGNPSANLTSATGLDLSAGGDVKVHVWYRPNGAPLEDVQVYNASVKLVLQAGEPADLKASIWPGITTYNDMDDFTFTMRPENFALRGEFSWYDALFALVSIAGTMGKHRGPPGIFAELDGRITAGEDVIGRFCLDKGDKTRLDLMDVCTRGTRGSADYEYAVAVA